MTKPIVYGATAYRQSMDPNAPWIVSTVVSATELVAWAGVPRRTSDLLVGFQRLETESRIQQARDFFRIGPNQSPTALILGVHPVASESDRVVSLSFLDDDPEKSVRRCTLTVNYSDDDIPDNEVLRRVRAQIDYRLADPAQVIIENENDLEDYEENAEQNYEAEGAAVEDEDGSSPGESIFGGRRGDDSSDQEIEIGRSLLRQLRESLDKPEWVQANIEALRDLAKPATVIDGQHRLKGAYLCERSIPFTVCLLFDCSWPEQVFQFTVVNYTAVGIPDQFITANAALSLTQQELAELSTRLVQAKVKVVEYELMRAVHFDRQSPFFELVNLSERADASKIGYKTMVKIAKAWYQARISPMPNLLLPNLYPGVRSRSAKTIRMQMWKSSDDWSCFFRAFWSVAKKHFEDVPTERGGTLWEVGKSNLMIAIVLFEFQATFFIDLNNQDEEFFDCKGSEHPRVHLLNKIEKRAEKFVAYYPPEFFATTWKMHSLNMSGGRVALTDALHQLLQSKGKYQYSKSQLFTGRVS